MYTKVRGFKRGVERSKMKSKWKVTSNIVGSEKMYGVYRTINTDETDHSGNREMAGGFIENKDAAQVIADNLNAELEATK